MQVPAYYFNSLMRMSFNCTVIANPAWACSPITPEVARRNSPVHLAPTRPTPLVLAVGGTEGAEYHRQTSDLASAWRRQGVPIEVMDLQGHDHFSIVAELRSPFSPLARAIQGQMGLA